MAGEFRHLTDNEIYRAIRAVEQNRSLFISPMSEILFPFELTEKLCARDIETFVPEKSISVDYPTHPSGARTIEYVDVDEEVYATALAMRAYGPPAFSGAYLLQSNDTAYAHFYRTGKKDVATWRTMGYGGRDEIRGKFERSTGFFLPYDRFQNIVFLHADIEPDKNYAGLFESAVKMAAADTEHHKGACFITDIKQFYESVPVDFHSSATKDSVAERAFLRCLDAWKIKSTGRGIRASMPSSAILAKQIHAAVCKHMNEMAKKSPVLQKETVLGIRLADNYVFFCPNTSAAIEISRLFEESLWRVFKGRSNRSASKVLSLYKGAADVFPGRILHAYSYDTNADTSDEPRWLDKKTVIGILSAIHEFPDGNGEVFRSVIMHNTFRELYIRNRALLSSDQAARKFALLVWMFKRRDPEKRIEDIHTFLTLYGQHFELLLDAPCDILPVPSEIINALSRPDAMAAVSVSSVSLMRLLRHFATPMIKNQQPLSRETIVGTVTSFMKQMDEFSDDGPALGIRHVIFEWLEKNMCVLQMNRAAIDSIFERSINGACPELAKLYYDRIVPLTKKDSNAKRVCGCREDDPFDVGRIPDGVEFILPHE